MNSRQAFEIRFHDVAYATDTRITSKFWHRAGFGAPRFSQGLERHIETDFIPIFETVGYGLCDVIDTYRHALYEMLFLTFIKRCAGEPEHSQREIIDRGAPSFSIEGKPDFMRSLGGKIMKS
jgi:hypothetical protein